MLENNTARIVLALSGLFFVMAIIVVMIDSGFAKDFMDTLYRITQNRVPGL